MNKQAFIAGYLRKQAYSSFSSPVGPQSKPNDIYTATDERESLVQGPRKSKDGASMRSGKVIGPNDSPLGNMPKTNPAEGVATSTVKEQASNAQPAGTGTPVFPSFIHSK